MMNLFFGTNQPRIFNSKSSGKQNCKGSAGDDASEPRVLNTKANLIPYDSNKPSHKNTDISSAELVVPKIIKVMDYDDGLNTIQVYDNKVPIKYLENVTEVIMKNGFTYGWRSNDGLGNSFLLINVYFFDKYYSIYIF